MNSDQLNVNTVVGRDILRDMHVGVPTEIKTPSTLLHVLGVIYMKREEMTL